MAEVEQPQRHEAGNVQPAPPHELTPEAVLPEAVPASGDVLDQNNPRPQDDGDHPRDEDREMSPAPEVRPPSRSGEVGSNVPPSSPSTAHDSHADGPDDEGNDSEPHHVPYGTRSRNRTGPRPNYADVDDPELDAVETRHLRSPGSMSTANALQRIDDLIEDARHQRDMDVDGWNGSTATTLPPSSGSASPAPGLLGLPEKKRKRGRQSGTKSVVNAQAVRDGIPGMSQFLANPSELDAPPPKRRKGANVNGVDVPSDPASAPGRGRGRKVVRSVPAHERLSDCAVVTFEKTDCRLKNGRLEADDGETYAVDDTVYLVCEPPGDPYYLCRIMEFRRDDMTDPNAPVTSLLINWFYRPKDIQRSSTDPRFVYASMQSDECPLFSLRGKCTIKHKSQIQDLEEFRKERDTFWFNQLYDRYISRQYDMLPVSKVVNVPDNVKKVLLERWKFLIVEPARLRELTADAKLCKRCNGYCAPDDSVDCGVCRQTWHMACVKPPMVKKPTRGFAWSCGPCSKAQERRLEQRHTAIINDEPEEEVMEEEEEDGALMPRSAPPGSDTSELIPANLAEVAKAGMWPWRYLGIHSKVDDILQLDDRAIYPRASSRLGPRHQAIVYTWHGRAVQLMPRPETKRKYLRGPAAKKDPKTIKDNVAALEADKLDRAKRPKWMQDEPPGYVARGEDYENDDPRCTAQRVFIMAEETKPTFAAVNTSQQARGRTVDEYIEQAKALAVEWGLTRTIYPDFQARIPDSISKDQKIVPTNFLDRAYRLLYKNKFNTGAALSELGSSHGPNDLSEPNLTKEEMKKFEDGVAKFGSELRNVRKLVKSRTHGEIVRLYYSWKKSERGQQLWGLNDARRGRARRAEISWTEIADDEDDSAFDNDKARNRKRGFQCKFCSTRTSRQWRRAPQVAPGATVLADPKGSVREKANQLVVALCQRCAGVWRRYGLRWEDPEELARSITQPGVRLWKKKTDEELLREFVLGNEAAGVATAPLAAQVANTLGITVAAQQTIENAKKKSRPGSDKESTPALGSVEPVRKPAPAPPPAPRPPTPPIVPQQPKMKVFPCAVCREGENEPHKLLVCKKCRLAVHRQCFGVSEQIRADKWVCETCANDDDSLVNLHYSCILCTTSNRMPDMVQLPKTSRKKTERDREREKLEHALAEDLTRKYRREQESLGRPLYPREPLKKTASNNWMHVTCAIWMPEIKFSDATRMEKAEGMAAVIALQSRMETLCKLCREDRGACVSCYQCNATFHIGCAHEVGYTFGFDVMPVKGARKDGLPIVNLGQETGAMTPVIFCKEHTPKTIVHGMNEVVADTGLTALQTFVRAYKQADLTLTGTARKANLLGQAARAVATHSQSPVGRNPSVITNGHTAAANRRNSAQSFGAEGGVMSNGIHDTSHESAVRQCVDCHAESAVRWWPVTRADPGTSQEVKCFQCHKCRFQFKLSQLPPTPTDEPGTPDKDQYQPDFFELTARPVHNPPPPLLNPWPSYGGYFAPQASPQSDPQSELHTLEKWTKSLHSSKIILTDPTREAQHKYKGKDFGNISDSPQDTWQALIRGAQQDIRYYDPNEHAIQTNDGDYIFNTATLMTALSKVVQSPLDTFYWTLVPRSQAPAETTPTPQPQANGAPPLMNGFYLPGQPVPAYHYPPNAPLAYHHMQNLRAMPPQSQGPPTPTSATGSMQRQMSEAAASLAAPSAGHTSPPPKSEHSGTSSFHFPHRQSPMEAGPDPQGNGMTSPRSGTFLPVRRPSTPSQTGQQGPAPLVNGASSSPNVKNLLQ